MKTSIIILFFCLCLTYIQKNDSKNQSDSMRIDTIQLFRQHYYSDTAFVSMNKYSKDFFFDMRYAGTNNFLKQKVYDCDECLVRREVAEHLIAANAHFKKKGFQIKFFDCYRPLDVQKLMWEIFPDGRYVANPYTNGSIHNKGGAVDITLVDLNGNELDMGTEFDFFGQASHHNFDNLSDTVLTNRKLLKSTMESFSFVSIRSEWWHYNFIDSKDYSLSNFKTNCN